MMAGKTLLVTACCMLVGAGPAVAVKIGDWITPCSLKDPQIAQCVVTQSREVWPHLATGVKEWGLKTSDPLFVPLVELITGGNRAVNVHVISRNLTFYGLKDVQFNTARVDPKKLHFEFDIIFPMLRGNNRYEISGKLLLLPISGSGYGNFTYDHLDCKLLMDCKPVVRDGKKYLQLEKLNFVLNSVKNSYLRLDNLFGKKELSDRMNKFMNDNHEALFLEWKTGVEKALSDIVFPSIDDFLKHVPFDELFTD